MERDGIWNPSFSAPLTIIEPVLWHIQVTINECMSAPCDIGQKDPYLAALHSDASPTILLFDPC
jgi:hypothetical protein